jgi:outer membrane protein TolC
MGLHVGKPLSSLLPAALVNAGVDVQQPIYVGGKLKLGKEVTGKLVEISKGQKRMTESEVLLAVESAYWQTVQVKEKIKLAEKYREIDAGLIYKNDLLRVEVSLNEAELNLSKARDGLALSTLNLAQLIGQPGNTDLVISDTVGGSFQQLQPAGLGNMADSRPEIEVLKKIIDAEQLQTRLIKADMKPAIGIGVSGIGAAGKHINFANGNNLMTTYYAAVNLSVPIFDWGKNKKKASEQESKIKASQMQLDETKEMVNLQIQQAYLQLNHSVRKISLSGLSLKQAEENLRLANDRYEAGTIVVKDVQEAQAIWQNAYSSLIDAQVEYKINDAVYRKVTGVIQ